MKNRESGTASTAPENVQTLQRIATVNIPSEVFKGDCLTIQSDLYSALPSMYQALARVLVNHNRLIIEEV